MKMLKSSFLNFKAIDKAANNFSFYFLKILRFKDS